MSGQLENQIMTVALRSATAAVDAKNVLVKRKIRREIGRKVNLELAKQTERELANALTPVFKEQIASIVRNLKLQAGKSGWYEEKGEQAGHEFHGNQWTGGGGTQSEGKKKQTDTPEFKAWFKDSKVVNEDGSPKVVYHGTRSDFHVFQTDPTKEGFGVFDQMLGSHFAEDPSVTGAFTVGEYARSYDYNISSDPSSSWHRDPKTGKVIYGNEPGAGIPMISRANDSGERVTEIYDPKVHGSTYSIRDKWGKDAELSMVLPGGQTKAVYLSIQKPLVITPEERESDQSAIPRAVMLEVFPHDRQLFVDAFTHGAGGSKENAGKIWDTITSGGTYDRGEYEKYSSFGDVARNRSTLLSDAGIATRAKAVLEKLGYDGVKYVNTSGNEVKGKANPWAWIAFRPTQIKSATGNVGKFDPNDPDIRKNFAGKSFVIHDQRWLMETLPNVRQPNSWSCILPGQILQGEVIGGSESWYAGEAIKIHTARGSVLSVTPNHPILTMMGFAPAGRLEEGQSLLHYVGEDESSLFGDNEQYAPAVVEKVFRSLESVFASEEVASSTLDFHGDAERFQGKIKVVGSYCQLGCYNEANGPKSFSQRNFIGSNTNLPGKSRGGGLNVGFYGTLPSERCFVGWQNLGDALFITHSIPDDFACLPPISNRNPLVDECSYKHPFSDVVGLRQLFQGRPRLVGFDDVVDIGNFGSESGCKFVGLHWNDSYFTKSAVDDLSAEPAPPGKFTDRSPVVMFSDDCVDVISRGTLSESCRFVHFSSGANRDVCLNEPSFQHARGKSELVCQSMQPNPRLVELGNLIQISDLDYSRSTSNSSVVRSRSQTDSRFTKGLSDGVRSNVVSFSKILNRRSVDVCLGDLDGIEQSGPTESGPKSLCFGHASQFDVGFSQLQSYGIARDVVLFRELKNAFPGLILPDKITRIERFHYEGPVYDFESPKGWIILQNTVISNCGAAAVHGVTSLYKVGATTLEETAKSLWTTEKDGTHPDVIVDYLESLGLVVQAREGMTIQDLQGFTIRGVPVIACVQDYKEPTEPIGSFESGHYLSVVGVIPGFVIAQDSSICNLEDEPGGSVKPGSPCEDNDVNIEAHGRVLIRWEDWLNNWHDEDGDGKKYNQFGIAVFPPLVSGDKSLGNPYRDELGRFASGPGGMSPDAGGTFGGGATHRYAADVMLGASKIKVTNEIVTSESVGRRDYDEIENLLTPDELNDLKSFLDEQRSNYIDNKVEMFEPDVDEKGVAENAGWDDKGVRDKADDLAAKEDEDKQEEILGVIQSWYSETRDYGEDAVVGLAESLREAGHDDFANKVEELKSEARDEIEQALVSEEERQREDYSENIGNGYDDTDDSREWLRDFYDDHEDEPRFSGESTKGVWGIDGSGDAQYSFETSGGKTYDIMTQRKRGLEGVEPLEVLFSDDKGHFDVTGAGHAVEVFRKVCPAVVALVKNKDLESLYFSAAANDTSKDGKSRQRLYDRLVRTIATAMPEYAAVAVTTPRDPDYKGYIVVKRDRLEKYREAVLKNRYMPDAAISDLVKGGQGDYIFTVLEPGIEDGWLAEEGWPELVGEKGGQGSGNFGHGGRPGEVGGSGEGGTGKLLKLKVVKSRAFDGEPVETNAKLGKSETGKLGEQIIISYLVMTGKEDARHLNLDRNNFPIDLIQDHESIEAKAGLVSNGKDAMKWRLTIGEPGKAEKEMLKNATEGEKAKWNARKQEMITVRKAQCLKNVSKEIGKRVKAKTMTVIINPDKKTADVFEFDGWHDRIRWNSDEAKKAYKATVKYV